MKICSRQELEVTVTGIIIMSVWLATWGLESTARRVDRSAAHPSSQTSAPGASEALPSAADASCQPGAWVLTSAAWVHELRAPN